MSELRFVLAATVWMAACSESAGEPTVDAHALPPGVDAQVSIDAASDAGLDAAASCVTPDSGLPDDVFCTGLYFGRDPSRHASDVMAYAPALKFWSDGAQKDRFLHLPSGSQIDTSDLDAWIFPVGTKAWKEFHVDGRLVETRIYWKRAEAKWEWGAYIWNADGTEASLDASLKPTLLPNGYEIPTARDCAKCHEGGADQLLGVEAINLGLPESAGVTLAALAMDGRLTSPPSPLTAQLPEDSTGKAAAALGYLHVNCGVPCHSSRGLGDETLLVMRLRATERWPTDAGTPTPVEQTDTYRATVNKAPTTASAAQRFPNTYRIAPGSHAGSLVYQLSNLRGNYQMPPLVSHVVDDAGMSTLAAWIDTLPVTQAP